MLSAFCHMTHCMSVEISFNVKTVIHTHYKNVNYHRSVLQPQWTENDNDLSGSYHMTQQWDN